MLSSPTKSLSDSAGAADVLRRMQQGSSNSSDRGPTNGRPTSGSLIFPEIPSDKGAGGAAAAVSPFYTPVRRAATDARLKMQQQASAATTPADKKSATLKDDTPTASKRQKSETTNPAVEAIKLWNDSFLPLTEKYLILVINAGPISMEESTNLSEQISVLNKVIVEYSKAADRFKNDIATTTKMLRLVVSYFHWRLNPTINHQLANDAYKGALEAKAAADSTADTSSKKEHYNQILNNLSDNIFHVGNYNDVLVLKCIILLELHKIELDVANKLAFFAQAKIFYEQIPCPEFPLPH